jgi:hypothetical protein
MLLLLLLLLQESSMLSALDGRPFLVLGSPHHEVCVEQLWQQHLDTLAWKKRAAEGRRRKKRHSSTPPGESALAWLSFCCNCYGRTALPHTTR